VPDEVEGEAQVLCWAGSLLRGEKEKEEMSDAEKALTVFEAAEMLRIKPRTMAMWCRDGSFPAFKAGKEWRIAESTVNKALRGELELKRKKKAI